MEAGSDLANLEEQRLGLLAISMKRYLGVPLTERIVSPDHQIWSGKIDHVSVHLEYWNVSNDHPWWCRVQVVVGLTTIKILYASESEREVRSGLKAELRKNLEQTREVVESLLV